jgi:hypothetical protein
MISTSLEYPQNLAERSPADAEFFGPFLFDKTLARIEAPLNDRPLEMLSGNGGKRPRQFRNCRDAVR